jgi:transposase
VNDETEDRASQDGAERTIKDVHRQTRKRYSAEEKIIRIVLAGLRGEDSIAELCRREGIAQSQYYSWSKEFLEAGKKRLAGDTAREASTSEVRLTSKRVQFRGSRSLMKDQEALSWNWEPNPKPTLSRSDERRKRQCQMKRGRL